MFLQEKQIEKAGVHQFPMSTFQKYEQRKFTCIVWLFPAVWFTSCFTLYLICGIASNGAINDRSVERVCCWQHALVLQPQKFSVQVGVYTFDTRQMFFVSRGSKHNCKVGLNRSLLKTRQWSQTILDVLCAVLVVLRSSHSDQNVPTRGEVSFSGS